MIDKQQTNSIFEYVQTCISNKVPINVTGFRESEVRFRGSV